MTGRTHLEKNAKIARDTKKKRERKQQIGEKRRKKKRRAESVEMYSFCHFQTKQLVLLSLAVWRTCEIYESCGLLLALLAAMYRLK